MLRDKENAAMHAAIARAERAEAERDSVQHLFAQQERHRDELLAENAALRKTLEDLLAANIDVWINSPEGRAYITSVTAMLKTSK